MRFIFLVLFFSILSSFAVASDKADGYVGIGYGQITPTETGWTSGTSGHIKTAVTQEQGLGVVFEYAQTVVPVKSGTTEVDYKYKSIYLTYNLSFFSVLNAKLMYGAVNATATVSTLTANSTESSYGAELGLELFSGIELYADYTVIGKDTVVISGGLQYHFDN